MHWKIEPWRHIALLHLCGDISGMFLGAVPFGKIQMVTAAIYVSLDQPRYRRNTGVPGPYRFVTMTVKACSADQCLRLGRTPRGLPSPWWIDMGATEGNELNKDGCNQGRF